MNFAMSSEKFPVNKNATSFADDCVSFFSPNNMMRTQDTHQGDVGSTQPDQN